MRIEVWAGRGPAERRGGPVPAPRRRGGPGARVGGDARAPGERHVSLPLSRAFASWEYVGLA